MMIRKLRAVVIMFFVVISVTAKADMPTIDVAAITSSEVNAVTQYGQLVASYEQLQQLQAIASGKTAFANILDNSLFMSVMPEDLGQALLDVRSKQGYAVCRNKLPVSNVAKTNAYYDNICISIATQQIFLKLATERQAGIAATQKQLGAAKTPAEKSDLQNSLAYQQTQMAADTAYMGQINDSMKASQDDASRSRRASNNCREFSPNPSGC